MRYLIVLDTIVWIREKKKQSFTFRFQFIPIFNWLGRSFCCKAYFCKKNYTQRMLWIGLLLFFLFLCMYLRLCVSCAVLLLRCWCFGASVYRIYSANLHLLLLQNEWIVTIIAANAKPIVVCKMSRGKVDYTCLQSCDP